MWSNLGRDHPDKRFLDEDSNLSNNSNKFYAQQHIYTWEARQDKTHYQYFTLENMETGMSSV
jgi:predicted SAM-dependent methyltransferase